MNVSKIFIKRPVTILLIVTGLCAFGVFAYFKLPVSDLPNVDYPVVTVTAYYPGASPETMADAVASPLEQQLIQIQGLKRVISTSTDSFTKIILTFDLNSNVDTAIPDIQSAISNAKANMPQLPDDPQFKKYNPSDKPVMYILVDSDSISHGKLFDLANKKIAQPVNMLEGISTVTIWSVSSAVRIKLNPKKMADYGITLSDVTQVIQNSTAMSSGGSLSNKYTTLAIEPKGQLTTPEEYNNLIIRYTENGPVKISDIGKAYLSNEQPDYMLKYFSGQKKESVNPVMIAISRREGANTIDLIERIKSMLGKISNELPQTLNVSVIYDKSKSILNSIYDVKITLLLALILVVVIIYIFMGRFTYTFIPGIIMPVSLLFTFLIMFILKYSIDNLSLLALTLAVGFIVDDAIVVLENTIRHIEKGKEPYNAAVISSREIAGSIISMTLSLIIVFIPIIFTGGIIGRIFREFAVTAIIIISCSGMLSLTLTPMMCAHILKSIEKAKRSKLQFTVNYLLKKIIRKYGNYLKYFLNRPYLSLAIWGLSIVLILVFYFIIPKNFLPPGDSGTIFGAIKAPIGVSSEQMQKYQDQIDNILKNDKNVSRFFSITGIYQGADQSKGLLSVMLKNPDSRRSMNAVVKRLRRDFSGMSFNLGSVYIAPVPVLDITDGGETTANGAQYSFIVTGLNSDNVYKYALELEQKLKHESEFADVQSDVELNMPQLKLEILRNKASSLGVNVCDIENALLEAYSKGRVTQFSKNSNFYDVIIELDDKYSKGATDLSNIYLRSSFSGKMIPLSTVASWKEVVGPQSVTHYQQLSAATISFNLTPGVPLGNAVSKLTYLAKQIFPATITGQLQGEAQQFAATEHNFIILIFIAVFLMYIVLGVLYESYIHPFTVLTTLPVAIVGGLGTIVLFNSQLSIFAYVGMFLLLGIIVKNGIMMVDMAIQKIEHENKAPFEAIYSACLIRFRPILMTGLTSIFGAIPIAIGFGDNAPMRRPLGLIILGGLIVAQILNLFVTPGIFLYMQKFQEKYLNRYRLTKSYRIK